MFDVKTENNGVTDTTNEKTNRTIGLNGHQTINNNDMPVLTSPGSEYWLKRNPVADQVFITDVTVNLKTVTIRECKTEKGFFKDRNDNSRPSDVV